MSNAARSLFVFGLYLLLVGLGLLVVPNLLLAMFFLAGTDEVWVRVLGMVTLFLGIYYIQAARNEMTDFIQLTVYVRSTTILFLAAFVLLRFASPFLLPFGVVDLLGAAWTGMALRSSKIA